MLAALYLYLIEHQPLVPAVHHHQKSFDLNGESLQAGSSLSGGTCTWDSDGTFTHTNGSVILLGGDICGDTDATFYDLTVGGSGDNTISVKTPQDPTVTNTLDVDTGDTLSIDVNRTVTHSGAALTLDGTISGAGTMTFTDTSSGPGTSGTLSSVVRYDATGGNVPTTTFDARTYGGDVEAYSNESLGKNLLGPCRHHGPRQNPPYLTCCCMLLIEQCPLKNK